MSFSNPTQVAVLNQPTEEQQEQIVRKSRARTILQGVVADVEAGTQPTPEEAPEKPSVLGN